MVPSDDNQNPPGETYGSKAVGLGFNPSGNPAVDIIKKAAADLIQECYEYRETATDPEVKRMFSVAITEAQTAQMWAVKAVTWTR
jgi:hypothetical protein